MSGENGNWFTEAELPYGKRGIKLGVEVKETLHDERSEWGHLQVLDTHYYGRMLAIDGIIQVTESDEFIYHEMMTTLPGLQQGDPKKVLIIGGGDGGALKHALRWKNAESVTQVEIDPTVSELSRKYLPKVAEDAFEDSKARLVYQDAYDFVENTDEKFDVIAIDLTDPVPDGPAARLFSEKFIENVSKCLALGGVATLQCGSLLFQPDEIRDQVENMKKNFSDVRLHNAVIPSYQLTSFAILVASNRPLKQLTQEEFAAGTEGLSNENRFLNYEMYKATQALPPYLKEELGQ